jgi:hypothetical protein
LAAVRRESPRRRRLSGIERRRANSKCCSCH